VDRQHLEEPDSWQNVEEELAAVRGRYGPADRSEAYLLYLMHEMSLGKKWAQSVEDPRLTDEWRRLAAREERRNEVCDLQWLPKRCVPKRGVQKPGVQKPGVQKPGVQKPAAERVPAAGSPPAAHLVGASLLGAPLR